MMFDYIDSLYAQGTSDYSAGYVPEDWDDKDARDVSPYLMGWYQASMFDTGAWDLDDRNR